MISRLALGALFGTLGGALFACGGADPDAAIAAPDVATQRQEIRPTDGTGANNNGYGIPAAVYDPPGNHFRVWYVTTSENAVDLTDESPKDGVPDFVEQVGAAAEKTYQSTVVERGFRPPLDDSIYHDSPDFGGDGRFDIYLRWAGAGSDGYRVTEVCTDGSDGGSRGRCAGYFVMNPSFKDSSYPSEQGGIEVLTSHELFHAIQDAYASGQWRTLAEGTAVWNELQVYPDDDATWHDYLGFLPALFQAPERPIDQSMGSGGAASFAYGTAAWFEYLSERFGSAIIRELWQGCEAPPTGDAPPFIDVIDGLLRKEYQSSLPAAFTEFTRWNLLTADRATTGFGYQRAAEYPAVRFEADVTAIGQSASVEIDGLSARYLAFRPALGQPTAVHVTVADPMSDPPVAALSIQHTNQMLSPLTELGTPQDVTLQPGEALLVAVTGAVEGGNDRMVSVRFDTPPPPSMSDPASGGCALATQRSRPDRAPLFALLFGVALLLGRRRFRPTCA